MSALPPIELPPAASAAVDSSSTSSERQQQQDSPTTSSSERRATFRKRRLSLPLHHLSTGDNNSDIDHSSHYHQDEQPPSSVEQHQSSPLDDASSHDNNADAKAHTFRKRRLSLTHSNHGVDHHHHSSSNDTTTTNNNKRTRRGSDASLESVPPSQQQQQQQRSKTMHSGELIAADGPPPSPAVHRDNVLYTSRLSLPPQLVLPPQQFSQQQQPAVLLPRWSKRRTVSSGDEHKLPFPPDIVGTYSCHGVEPVYDSCYEDDEEDDEARGGAWDLLGEPAAAVLGDTSPSEHASFHSNNNNKPTMAAKINQDRGGVAYPYGNCNRTALFAVYDGHGQGGELVSQFALHEIQRRLEKHEHFETDLGRAFKETFLAVDEALKYEPMIEPLFAGTTACVALLTDTTITVSNAGDSRAVLARHVMGQDWQAIDLTRDQNPDVPAEWQRITAAGGYVTPSPGPGLSARVWLDPMCTQIGLAMARSIGDHAVSAVGVIAEPVVTTHVVTVQDEFLIVASDGVWEFLTSSAAVQLVGENLHRGATKACQALIEAAAAKWHEEEGEYRDDITAIVVQLQRLWENNNNSQQQRADDKPV